MPEIADGQDLHDRGRHTHGLCSTAGVLTGPVGPAHEVSRWFAETGGGEHGAGRRSRTTVRAAKAPAAKAPGPVARRPAAPTWAWTRPSTRFGQGPG